MFEYKENDILNFGCSLYCFVGFFFGNVRLNELTAAFKKKSIQTEYNPYCRPTSLI